PGAHSAHRQAQAALVAQSRHLHVGALGEREEVDLVPEPDQGAGHGEHGQRRPSHLEERLRGEEQDPQWLRKRSAAMGARHPGPAAVTAGRWRWSATSPAAKTPGTLVAVVPSLVSM